MQDFAPFCTIYPRASLGLERPPVVKQLHFAQLVNPQSGLKGHFMLWRATRLRNLGALLATY